MIFNSQGDAKLRQYINGQTITPGEEEITLPGKSILLGDVVIAAADTEAAYQEGYNAGYAAGYSEGYAIGYEEGMAEAAVDNNTIFLLHGDSLMDSSPNAYAITNNGVAVSSHSKFGKGSLYFASGKYLTFPSIDFGAGDFTIEWWEYVTESNAGTRFANIFANSYSSQAGGILIGPTAGNTLIYLSTGAAFNWDVLNAQKVFNTNAYSAWVHRAIVREGTQLKVYTNGSLERTFSIGSGSVGRNAALPCAIGAWAKDLMVDGFVFKGYIEEFRISNIARWNSNFTPPTEPY